MVSVICYRLSLSSNCSRFCSSFSVNSKRKKKDVNNNQKENNYCLLKPAFGISCRLSSKDTTHDRFYLSLRLLPCFELCTSKEGEEKQRILQSSLSFCSQTWILSMEYPSNSNSLSTDGMPSCLRNALIRSS